MSAILDSLYDVKGLEFDPEVMFFECEDTIVRRMRGPKGAGVSMHVHESKGHLAILAKGRARLLTESGERECFAGDCIEIKKGERHGIVFLEDSIWFCIQSED